MRKEKLLKWSPDQQRINPACDAFFIISLEEQFSTRDYRWGHFYRSMSFSALDIQRWLIYTSKNDRFTNKQTTQTKKASD